MEGESHRMLDGRLAEIRSELNELTEAVGNLGAIFKGFFIAYAKAKAEETSDNRGFPTPQAAVWRDYLAEEEDGA